MNAFPPTPPFFPSQHRFPGHHAPRPARERAQIGSIILPPEARIAQRIFQCPQAARSARPGPVASAAPQPRPPNPLVWLLRALRRALAGNAA